MYSSIAVCHFQQHVAVANGTWFAPAGDILAAQMEDHIRGG